MESARKIWSLSYPLGGLIILVPNVQQSVLWGLSRRGPHFFATPIREILKIILVTAGIPIISALPGFLVGNSFRIWC